MARGPVAIRRRCRRALAAALAGAGSTFLRRPGAFVVPRAEATVTAASVAAADRVPAELSDHPLANWPQMILADMKLLSDDDRFGPDYFFYIYLGTSLLIVIVVIYILTKPYWENRWLVERINSQKLKFITQEENTTAEDRYDLARMYISLEDYPAALGEFEEVEEDFSNIRPLLDPEDTLGALSSRAMLHNSKGFALMKLEPPKTAQARREFVRAVTYWPEYPEALLNIGRELIKRKRFDVAVRTLNTALKWQPAYPLLQAAAKEARKGLNASDEDDEDED